VLDKEFINCLLEKDSKRSYWNEKDLKFKNRPWQKRLSKILILLNLTYLSIKRKYLQSIILNLTNINNRKEVLLGL